MPSQYVQQGITQWISRWLRNGWRTADKKPVKNVELWQTLYQLDQELHPAWQWVKGHAGNTYNELCDSMGSPYCGAWSRDSSGLSGNKAYCAGNCGCQSQPSYG